MQNSDSLIECRGLSPHLYADDTQVYGSCPPAAVDALLSQVTECANDVATEVLWCATSRHQHQLPSTGMLIDGIHITPVKSVRDLRIYTDADLSMRMHVKKTVSCCFAALHQLRQIRRYVPTSTFQKLVVALVHSWLDYGNGVLVGIPAYIMHWLQSVLNAVAQLIFNLKRSDHITDALVSLHWLLVPERIQYKIAVLSYKVLLDTTPWYLGPLTRVVDIPGRWAVSTLAAPIAWKYLISNFPPLAAKLFRLHLTDLELTTRHSRFGVNTVVVPAPIENFFIATILYLLAL